VPPVNNPPIPGPPVKLPPSPVPPVTNPPTTTPPVTLPPSPVPPVSLPPTGANGAGIMSAAATPVPVGGPTFLHGTFILQFGGPSSTLPPPL
jgi:hypothetical protein